MSQSLQDRKTLIRSGQPIEALELTFYPITMAQYDEYLLCREALSLRLAALPVEYAFMDYLSALWAAEVDAVKARSVRTGMFEHALRLLYMSLRIDYDFTDVLQHHIKLRETDGALAIEYLSITQNGNTVRITPHVFSMQIRPLLAEMNGIELPDESHNIDLVESNEQLKRLKSSGIPLKVSTDDLIASVAYLTHTPIRNIYGWTVRDFELLRRAIDRDKHYMLYAQAEMSGMVKFNKGNPFPSWCYDVSDDSYGTMALSELQSRMGQAEQKT